MVSDLKSDLVMTSSQRRPNIHLKGNPAVVVEGTKVKRRRHQKVRKADKLTKTGGAAETKQRVKNMCCTGHQRSRKARKHPIATQQQLQQV